MAPVSVARKALLAVLQRTRAIHVAKTAGVHWSRVSRWASGTDVPGPRARARLEARYGIRVDDWDRLPSTNR